MSNQQNKTIILSSSNKIQEKLKRISKLDDFEIDYNNQLKLINQLFLEENLNENKSLIRLKREIEIKINGYKQQDIKKKLYDENLFIKLEDIVEMIVSCKIKCYYCNSKMKIIYKYVRDNLQWTLDRIDNNDGHTKNNTLVCCLKCNLQRRCINKDKFDFTKKLSSTTIKKLD